MRCLLSGPVLIAALGLVATLVPSACGGRTPLSSEGPGDAGAGRLPDVTVNADGALAPDLPAPAVDRPQPLPDRPQPLPDRPGPMPDRPEPMDRPLPPPDIPGPLADGVAPDVLADVVIADDADPGATCPGGCPLGRFCVHGVCRNTSTCHNDASCRRYYGPGRLCIDGLCPPGSAQPCQAADECPAGFYCDLDSHFDDHFCLRR